MKYQLVLQWSASSQEDHDGVVAMTDDLEQALIEVADVDGWDFGSGEMNIFIYTDEPLAALEQARATLEVHGHWSGSRGVSGCRGRPLHCAVAQGLEHIRCGMTSV